MSRMGIKPIGLKVRNASIEFHDAIDATEVIVGVTDSPNGQQAWVILGQSEIREVIAALGKYLQPEVKKDGT